MLFRKGRQGQLHIPQIVFDEEDLFEVSVVRFHRPLRVAEAWKSKGGSAVDDAFGPRSSTMAVDDALDIGQSDARALEFFLAVQTLKDAEELLAILRIETGAIVANINQRFGVSVGCTADFNPRLRASAGEFQ